MSKFLIDQVGIQPDLKEDECALTLTEAFTCISALDDYFKSVEKSAQNQKRGIGGHRQHKKKFDAVEQLLNGAKSALVDGIRKAGAPSDHQKAVFEMLMTALYSTPTGSAVPKNSAAGLHFLKENLYFAVYNPVLYKHLASF